MNSSHRADVVSSYSIAKMSNVSGIDRAVYQRTLAASATLCCGKEYAA